MQQIQYKNTSEQLTQKDYVSNKLKNYSNNDPYANQQNTQIKDFYKLHYPAKRRQKLALQPRQSSKIRSKSMLSVLQQPDKKDYYYSNEVPQEYEGGKYNQEEQLGLLMSMNKHRNKGQRRNRDLSIKLQQKNSESQKQKIMMKYRQKIMKSQLGSSQKITFKRILSPSSQKPQSTQPANKQSLNSMISKLQLKSLKDIEQFSSKNLSLKQSIQHFKDQKIKISKLLLSHKQSQEIKLKYLEQKKKEVNQQMDKQIYEIYQRYFKKEYETKYGGKNGGKGNNMAFMEFQKNINELVKKLAVNLFV